MAPEQWLTGRKAALQELKYQSSALKATGLLESHRGEEAGAFQWKYLSKDSSYFGVYSKVTHQSYSLQPYKDHLLMSFYHATGQSHTLGRTFKWSRLDGDSR